MAKNSLNHSVDMNNNIQLKTKANERQTSAESESINLAIDPLLSFFTGIQTITQGYKILHYERNEIVDQPGAESLSMH